ncbi:MAG: DUF2802 domain-containing protein [Gammaproteobacteria bacterium]
MMSNYLSSSIPVNGFILLALLIFISSMLLLFGLLRRQQRQLGKQRSILNQMAEQFQNCNLNESGIQDQLEALHEQCKSLNARQQLVEKHGSDVQRIDLATRMLKRGVGNVETLQDLGLSASEIKLLLRLHGVPASKDKSPTRLEKELRSAVPEGSRKAPIAPTAIKQDASTRTDSQAVSSNSNPNSRQGRELAKLFETRVAS